jgi:hypothetical protein
MQEGTAMTATDKKRRKLAMAIGESFAAVRRRMARSLAWQNLSAPALKIYIELKLRWRHKDNNNGHLFVSIAECKNLLGIAPGTAHRAFRELQQKGFIVMTRRGEAGGLTPTVLDNGGFGYSRMATTWAITEEPYQAQPATHAYERWRPENQGRGSTSGTMTVPPAELFESNSSSSGTMEGGSRPPDSSTSGIPVSTISRVRSKRVPSGSQRQKAAWLRGHLEAGIVTPHAVASALAIRPDQVDPIAAGKIGLANTSWQKIAALVVTKRN